MGKFIFWKTIALVLGCFFVTTLAVASPRCENVFANSASVPLQKLMNQRDLQGLQEAHSKILKDGRFESADVESIYQFFVSLNENSVNRYSNERRDLLEKWKADFHNIQNHGFQYIDTLSWILKGVAITDLDRAGIRLKSYDSIFSDGLVSAPAFLKYAETLRKQNVAVIPFMNSSTDPHYLLFTDKEMAFLTNIGILPLEIVPVKKYADNAPLTSSQFVIHDISHYMDYARVFQATHHVRSDEGINDFIHATNAIKDKTVKNALFEILFHLQHEGGATFDYYVRTEFRSQDIFLADYVDLSQSQKNQIRQFLLKYFPRDN